jgi:hypothetical protein
MVVHVHLHRALRRRLRNDAADDENEKEEGNGNLSLHVSCEIESGAAKLFRNDDPHEPGSSQALSRSPHPAYE